MRLPKILCFVLSATAIVARADDSLASRYATVSIEPATTSVYVGTISVHAGRFKWVGNGYLSELAVDFMPYDFHDTVRARISLTQEQLRQIDLGNSVDFRGTVTRRDGLHRAITGHATPDGPSTGRLQVNIYLTSFLVVTFDTRYAVVAARPASTPAK